MKSTVISRYKRNKVSPFFLAMSFFLLTLAGCNSLSPTPIPEGRTATPALTLPTDTTSAIPSPTDTLTPIPTHTQKPTFTPIPSLTPTPTLTPTPALPVHAGTVLPPFLEVINPQNVAQLKEIAQIGAGILYDASLSADQQKVMAVFSSGIKIYDVKNLEEMSSCHLEIPEIPRNISNIWYGIPHAFSPNGTTFAFLTTEGVEIWKTKDCTLVQTVVLDEQLSGCAYQQRGLDLRISPDGQVVALSVTGFNCGNQPPVRWVWRVADGALLLKDSGKAIAFSADRTMIATGGGGNEPIKLWKASDFELMRTLPGQKNTIGLTFSRDGNLIACYENWIWSWDIDTGKVLKQISSRDNTSCHLLIIGNEELLSTAAKLWRLQDEKFITAPDGQPVVDISPNGKTLLSEYWDTSNDKLVEHLWSVAENKLLGKFYDPLLFEAGRSYSADGSMLAINSDPEPQNTLLINTLDGTLINTLEGNKPIFLPDGRSLLTWSSDHLNQWNIQDGSLIASLQFSPPGDLTGHVDQVSFSPDGAYLAASQRIPEIYDYAPSTIMVYQLKDLTPLQRFLAKGVHSFTFSPDGKQIALSTGQNIELRQILDGMISQTFEAGESFFRSISFSPDGAFLVTSKGNEILLWQLPDGKLLEQFSAGGRIINDLLFTSNEKLLASLNLSADSESIISFESTSGSILKRHDYSTWAGFQPLALSGDHRYLALITTEFRINVIKIEDWTIVNTIEIAPGPESASEGTVKLSQNGDILATNFNDGKVKFWNVADGTLLGTLDVYSTPPIGYSSPMVAMSFSPDGRLFAASGLGIIHVWGVVLP
jgi:WD40 repeat protein